jgi:hypothetical protein
MQATTQDLIAAFTQWDREYREEPDRFWSTVEHLVNQTPETYGDAATACFPAYIGRVQQEKG